MPEEKPFSEIVGFLQKHNWVVQTKAYREVSTATISNQNITVYIGLPNKADLPEKATIHGFLKHGDWELQCVVQENLSLQDPNVVNGALRTINEVVRKLRMLAKKDIARTFATITPNRLLPAQILEKFSLSPSEKILQLGYRRAQDSLVPMSAFLRIHYSDFEGHRVGWDLQRDEISCHFVWPRFQPVVVARKKETHGQFRSFMTLENIVGVLAPVEDCFPLFETVSPKLASYCEEATKAFSECWEVSY